MATEKNRYTVSVDDELFKKIENYRYKNRFQTRADATVSLLEVGLNALNETGNIDTFSVLPGGIDPQLFRSLKHQEQLLELIDYLLKLPPKQRRSVLTAISGYIKISALASQEE